MNTLCSDTLSYALCIFVQRTAIRYASQSLQALIDVLFSHQQTTTVVALSFTFTQFSDTFALLFDLRVNS